MAKNTTLTRKGPIQRITEQEYYFQFYGSEISSKDLMERAREDFVRKGNDSREIKLLKLYIKPEENAAYYVINGSIRGNISIT